MDTRPLRPDESFDRPRLGLPPEQFAAAFPFHIAVGRDLVVLQAGATIRRVCPDVKPGARLDQVLRMIRPEEMSMTFKTLVDHRSRFFLLEHPGTRMRLRGEFVLLPDREVLLFLGSPWLTDTAQIAAHGLGFEDFAIHDPVVDLLQVVQAGKLALEDAKKLASRLTSQRGELRAANERLLRQEAEARKLALIAARTDNAVVLTDPAGRTEWVNEGFTRITGYTLEEMKGRRPGDLLQGPGTDPQTVRLMSEQLKQGLGFSSEILNYRKDGRSYWISVHAQPIHDEQGRLVNFMALETDITERRKAQQRFAIQVEVSRALAGAENLAGAMPRVLQAVCECLDWQLGQLWRVGAGHLYFSEVWHSPAEFYADFVSASRAMTFGRGTGLPGRVWASGKAVWVADVLLEPDFPRGGLAEKEGLHGAIAIPVFARGELWGVMEFFSRNISEPDDSMLETFVAIGRQIGHLIVRRAAETALRESNALQQAILKGVTYSVIATTPEGVIITFNQAAERLLGYTAAEVVGARSPVLFHDPAELAARSAELSLELGRPVQPGIDTFAAKAALGDPDEREWTYLRKDGARIPVRLTVTALLDDNQKITGYVGIASDIRESKRVAAELLKSKEAAEAANRAKSDFLAVMSHEIRTPMNGILGMANLLADSKLDTRQSAFIDAVRASGEALLEIINDILDFSKIESSRLALEPQSFDLRWLVDGTMELLALRADAKNLAFAAIIAEGVPTAVRGDDGRLRQVLMNLLGNSIKFTQRGEVVLSVETVGWRGSRVRLRFSVRDTGIGIPPEEESKLFQPFSQMDSTSSRQYGGTGLGLVISKRLVELMEGRIGFESVPGRGSTFWFEVVLEAEPAPVREPLNPTLKAVRAWVASDSPAVRSSIGSLLQRWGIPALEADGAETTRRLQNLGSGPLPCDILIIDADLFETPGGASLQDLVLQASACDIKLIFLNRPARASKSTARFRAAGCLVKPVKETHLRDCIASMFNTLPGAATPPDPAPDPRPPAGPLRILVVEDHDINRQVTMFMLEKLGYRGDYAANGREAVEMWEKFPYDVVLMDCQMPEMDGYEATRKIRSLETAPGSPPRPRVAIVAMTANAMRGDREKCLGAGMDDYISKPVQLESLRTALNQAGSRAHDRAGASPPAEMFKSIEETLASLRSDFGPEATADLMTSFLEDTPPRCVEMRRLAGCRDREALVRAAHSLAGSCGIFGLHAMHETSLKLEEVAKKSPGPDCLPLIGILESQYEAVRPRLEEILQENKDLAAGAGGAA